MSVLLLVVIKYSWPLLFLEDDNPPPHTHTHPRTQIVHHNPELNADPHNIYLSSNTAASFLSNITDKSGTVSFIRLFAANSAFNCHLTPEFPPKIHILKPVPICLLCQHHSGIRNLFDWLCSKVSKLIHTFWHKTIPV